MRFVSLAESKERFQNAGVEPVGSSPQETAAVLKNEMSVWSRVIKEIGIKVD